VARSYFGALDAHEVDTAMALWAPEGHGHVRGEWEAHTPEELRRFNLELLEAVPDLRFEVRSTTSEGERCAVQWRLTGTFAGPGRLRGVAPTGDPIAIEGVDLLTVSGGLIRANDAFMDTTAIPRQIGMLPARDSTAERRMTDAFNLRTAVAQRVTAREPELVAEGVWVVQGQPGRCNVYLIEDEGGVTVYDAGARTMVRAVAGAAARFGGIRRVVLGHGHTDHRGTAPSLSAPVWCHPDEVRDAQGSGGFRYWPADLEGLPLGQRQIHRVLHRHFWDDGPVKIEGTLEEGEEVAGFRVVHLPGHAPGLIGLWRESDRLALVSDCFYTVDMWARDVDPHVPDRVYNFDTEQAAASIAKLAELEPAAAWPGHGRPVTGEVRAKLERAARQG